MAGRLHRHGDAVLVPVAHRALALDVCAHRGIEPRGRFGDRLAAQAVAGDVAPETDDADVGHVVGHGW